MIICVDDVGFTFPVLVLNMSAAFAVSIAVVACGAKHLERKHMSISRHKHCAGTNARARQTVCGLI